MHLTSLISPALLLVLYFLRESDLLPFALRGRGVEMVSVDLRKCQMY